MKLSELNLIDLFESIGYIVEDLTWEGDIGHFTINDQPYIVTVVPASKKDELTFVPFFEVVPKVGNLDFSMVTATGTEQDTTNTMGHYVFKVLASVAEAAKQLIDRYNYQIILCIAKRTASPTNFESRVNVYETLILRIAKSAGMLSMRLYNTTDAVVYVAYNVHLHKSMLRVQQHMSGKD